ncbi:MAG: chromate transporter [Alphaproteobacteria bacterium]|nr:chromate transporter [Alphaproteobacteria bacterium]
MNSDLEISVTLFLHFALLSMMAIGGGVLALTPEMLRFVTETHPWMTPQVFVECFTLAQIAPGPNLLFATLVGMQAAGLTGAVAATTALIVPPSILAMASLHFGAKVRWGGWGATIRRAIMPLSIGMVGATAWSLTTMTVHNWAQGLLFAAALGVMVKTRLNPLWLIAAGAGAGAMGWV